ncbi:MAG: LysR family transcriptional regulator, partial [Pseudomonadota bacterium]
MDLDQLQLVSDVARQGSFAAVAREHGLDPSSVSRAIASLEDTLGVRLFQRTTRRLSLTEAGATYLRFAEPALDELKRAQEAALSVSAEPRGTLRISASIAFGQAVLVPALERFRTAMPSVALDLVLTDTPLDLVAERIDLAIRLGRIDRAVAGEIVGAGDHEVARGG